LRLLAAAAVALVFPFALVSLGSAAEPTIETHEGGGNPIFSWSPSTASIGPGGTVGFKNNSNAVPHGVRWTGGPEKPGCSGVPIEETKTNWSGTCTFTQTGTYSFVCPLHPTEMKGSITVTNGGEPPPPPPGGAQSGPAASGLRLAGQQRGSSVRGSIEILPAGSGGSLKVELRAARNRLFGAGRKGMATAGRLVRSSLSASILPFSVSLNGAALRALRSLGTLTVNVTVTATAPGAESLKRTRTVVMHLKRRITP
jgi:plastocyanin